MKIKSNTKYNKKKYKYYIDNQFDNHIDYQNYNYIDHIIDVTLDVIILSGICYIVYNLSSSR